MISCSYKGKNVLEQGKECSMPKRKLKALKCSQCGYKARGITKGEALKKLGKHQHKEHPSWLSRRIKKGMKSSPKGAGTNPAWVQSVLAGVFPIANIGNIERQYVGMTPAEREVVKRIVTNVSGAIGGPPASIVGQIVLAALDEAGKAH